MIRRQLNVSGFLFFCPQEKKLYAKTEKKRILHSKGPSHFCAKNRNRFFFIFIFFKTRWVASGNDCTRQPPPMSWVVKTIKIFYQILSFPLRAPETCGSAIWCFFCGMGWLLKPGPFSGDKPRHYLSFGTMHESFLGTQPWWAWKQNSSSDE